LFGELDRVSWLLTKSGFFAVKSMYSFLVAKKVNFPFKALWTLKLSLRIKVFCWLAIKNRILTKENLKKKEWKRVELCEFCDDHETQEHLFFPCPLAKYVWSVVSVSLGICKLPKCFTDLYNDWFNTRSGRDKKASSLTHILLSGPWRLSGQFGKQEINLVFKEFVLEIS
jgi:hypothetical protein